MKTKESGASQNSPSPYGNGDSSKLVSLLALATGAVAMPQSSEADVVYSNMTANPAVIGAFHDISYQINFPGTAKLRFETFSTTNIFSTLRLVFAQQVPGPAYVKLKTSASFAIHVPQGFAWNDVPGFFYTSGIMGRASYSHHTPNNYDHEYVLFRFQDSLQGNALRYGWIEVGLFNQDTRFGIGEGPVTTIYGYAYDTTGAELKSGSVPEPSAAALLALGAMALGAKGLRSWRRNRPAV